jgi:hypothetical protein
MLLNRELNEKTTYGTLVFLQYTRKMAKVCYYVIFFLLYRLFFNFWQMRNLGELTNFYFLCMK